jgi:hypothetical protein
MCVDHIKIYAPSSLIDPSEKMIFLTNNIFTMDKLQAMTAEA